MSKNTVIRMDALVCIDQAKTQAERHINAKNVTNSKIINQTEVDLTSEPITVDLSVLLDKSHIIYDFSKASTIISLEMHNTTSLPETVHMRIKNITIGSELCSLIQNQAPKL